MPTRRTNKKPATSKLHGDKLKGATTRAAKPAAGKKRPVARAAAKIKAAAKRKRP